MCIILEVPAVTECWSLTIEVYWYLNLTIF